MKEIIQQAIQSGISFQEYEQLFEQLVAEGKTTGPNQSEGYVAYTKLNWSRYKRAAKNYVLTDETVNKLKEINEPLTLLIITEVWCGDASQSLPVLAKIAAINPLITARLVLRDEHEELMNNFLTNGGKAIPKVIILDEQLEVVNSWGPRPTVLQQQVKDFKAANPTATGMDISGITQKWYTEDKGKLLQEEVVSLLQSATISEAAL